VVTPCVLEKRSLGKWLAQSDAVDTRVFYLRPEIEGGSTVSKIVDFDKVSVAGLESSPVADALAGLRANEARYYMNKYKHEFTVTEASATFRVSRRKEPPSRFLSGLEGSPRV